VAIDDSINEIFVQMNYPIVFAADHCTLNQFSPFAVNCNCEKKFKAEMDIYKEIQTQITEEIKKEYSDIQKYLTLKTSYNKRNLLVSLYHAIRYYSSYKYYVLDENFKLDKKTQLWMNKYGEYIEEKYGLHQLFKNELNLHWSRDKNTFLREDGKSFFELSCNHLASQIENVFGLKVHPDDWQHWNGGVFLFDDSSHDFLNFWHDATMKIFENPEWKTRDQGTLIATVWKFGLQRQPLLDSKFNYIVDYTNQQQQYLGSLEFKDSKHERMKAHLLHIFHHFGDLEWNVWQDVETRVTSNFEREVKHE
jgi:hypothetical protein